MIFVVWNPEKIWHRQIVHFPTLPVYCSHFTLGNPKKSFSAVLFIHTANVKFSQDFTHQKTLKSVNFWQSYWKNKKWTIFGKQCTRRTKKRLVQVVAITQLRIILKRNRLWQIDNVGSLGRDEWLYCVASTSWKGIVRDCGSRRPTKQRRSRRKFNPFA